MTENFHWFEGDPKQSVFSVPFNSLAELHAYNTEMPDFFKKIEETGDDRSYVITSALVAEHQLDAFLLTLMPGYDKLAEKKDFTFSLKIELLKAHKIIPPIVPRCIDYLRRVRNEFAHNLLIDEIDSIEQKIINVGNNLYDDVYRVYKQNHSEKNTREIFNGILQGAIMGLRSYKPNVNLLRRLLNDNDFKLWMKKINNDEYKEEIGLLKK